MRTIDADMLIKRIKGLTPIGDIGEITIRQCIEIIKHMSVINTEDKWISCKKELPDNDDEVLIIFNEGFFDIGYFKYERINDFGYRWVFRTPYCTLIDEEIFSEIKAWMPLPEPYKDKENNYE